MNPEVALGSLDGLPTNTVRLKMHTDQGFHVYFDVLTNHNAEFTNHK